MAEVPDPFGRGRPQRVVRDANEDEIGKALPASVIRQLDANLGLLGRKAGAVRCCGGSASHAAGDLRTAPRHRPSPGRDRELEGRLVEVIDGQPNLVYDNHKAGRMRRRLPITGETAEDVLAWERHRAELGGPPVTQRWLFPTPLLRARSHSATSPRVASPGSFGNLVAKIGPLTASARPRRGACSIRPELIFPYALRHSTPTPRRAGVPSTC